jgi:hypothetical protein
MLESEVEGMQEYAIAIENAAKRTAESLKRIGEQFKRVAQELEV